MRLTSSEASTKHLIQLCIGYFIMYVITGVTVKYFLKFEGMKDFEFLVYGTGTAILIPTLVAMLFRWYEFEPLRYISFLQIKIPVEYFFLIPSGICTAIVIPTTTLMYSLPISVMVAMVLMRASIIVISRIIDTIQIQQGFLKKQVYLEENWGVVFAMCAIGVNLFGAGAKDFDFLKSPPAVIIFSAYIVAYAIRIYIMNYYKNITAKGKKLDNKAFFAIEQFASTTTLLAAAYLVFHSVEWFGWNLPQIHDFRAAFFHPHPKFMSAGFWGSFFGVAAFFSVFIFIFKGRTATFAGLVNRLTSLIAGTVATLLLWAFFGTKFPKQDEWISLVFILVSIYFTTRAEKKRTRELIVSHEMEEEPQGEVTVQRQQMAET